MKRRTDNVWATARRAALERDASRCVVRYPGCSGWAEHVHHINRRRPPNPHRLDMLASVCFSCHCQIHDHPAEAEAAGWLLRSSPVNRVLFTRKKEAS